MKQTFLFFVLLLTIAHSSSGQTLQSVTDSGHNITSNAIIIDNGGGKGRLSLLNENNVSKIFGTTTGFGTYQPIGLAGSRTLIASNGILPVDDGDATLQVNGNVVFSATQAGNKRGAKFHFDNYLGGRSTLIMDANGGDFVGLDYFYINHYQGNLGTSFENAGAVPLRFITNDAERMRINGDGNVGVGTATPVSKLHVNQGTTASQQELSAFSIGRNELTNGFYRFVTNYDAADISKIYLGIKTGADLYALTINNNTGNVAIGGTDSRGYKLSVAGSMIAEKIKVKNQTAWPDFVFDPGYQLPSLESVEGFIKVNKHLPEIPSAKDIARDDHDLAEMNKKLLQKVEELTLYLIDQQKQLAEQKAELTALKKQVRGKN